jgi:ADP-ribose pyrophosphatase YjhB (NUDIX family)
MKFDDKYDIARPYTACFVILRRNNKIAMILRKNTGWMDGHYGLPAGKGEWHETFTEIALREAREEAGVKILPKSLRMIHLAHRRSNNDTHFMDWVDVYFEADRWQGEPYNAEPEKSDRLEWIDLGNLPDNVVPSQRAALESIAKGEIYSEFGWPKA